MRPVVRGDKKLCVSVEDDGLHAGPRVYVCVCTHVYVRAPACQCVRAWSPTLCRYAHSESVEVN